MPNIWIVGAGTETSTLYDLIKDFVDPSLVSTTFSVPTKRGTGYLFTSQEYDITNIGQGRSGYLYFWFAERVVTEYKTTISFDMNIPEYEKEYITLYRNDDEITLSELTPDNIVSIRVQNADITLHDLETVKKTFNNTGYTVTIPTDTFWTSYSSGESI